MFYDSFVRHVAVIFRRISKQRSALLLTVLFAPSISALSPEGELLCEYLVTKNWTELEKLSLENVDANYKCGRRRSITALHFAAYYGHEGTFRKLLKKGADPLAKDHKGWTVLYAAAEGGNAEIVRILLERVVDPMAKDAEGYDVLSYAVGGGDAETVRVLLENGGDPWNAASILGYINDNRHPNPDVVFQLLSKAADMSSYHKRTFLQWAVENDSVETARLLVEKGADPMLEDTKGKTVLNMALARGNTEMVRFLLGKVANLPAYDAQTSMFLAIWSNNAEAVRLVVETGANPRATYPGEYGKGQRSGLHDAVRQNNVEITRFLLEQGVDPDIRDSYYDNVRAETSLHILIRGTGNLSQRDENRDRWDKVMAITRLLLEKGGDVSARGGCGETPLHLAAQHGHVNMIRFLLNAGADPLLTSAYAPGDGYCPNINETPADIARREGREEAFHILREAAGQ